MFSDKEKRFIRRAYVQFSSSRTDWMQERTHLALRIRAEAEHGKVAIVYGGMDCDCARWDNRHVVVPATVTHVRHWMDRYEEGAEGPQWSYVAAPSYAKRLVPESRDLALEAFEDGHPHSIHL